MKVPLLVASLCFTNDAMYNSDKIEIRSEKPRTQSQIDIRYESIQTEIKRLFETIGTTA